MKRNRWPAHGASFHQVGAAWVLWALAAFPAWANDSSPLPPASGFFERDEPNLASGVRALQEGRSDDAIAAFRRAKAQTKEERAVVEYDVGQALLQQGRSEIEAAEGEEAAGDSTQVFEEAAEAFERAYGLSENQRFQSAAALAAGNAKAQKGDLKGAVESFRKAMIADPKNEGARKNLASVLRAIQAQPPPPPSDSSENSDSDENSDDPNDDEQNNESEKKQNERDNSKSDPSQKGDSQPKPQDQDQKNDKDGKSAGSPEQQENGGEERKDAEKPGANAPSAAAGNPDEKKPEEGGQQKNAAAPKPDEKTKSQAQRLLDQMRNREKPLAPLWMRGNSSSRPPPEKDW